MIDHPVLWVVRDALGLGHHDTMQQVKINRNAPENL